MDVARAARTLLAESTDTPPPTGSLAECAELLGELQALVNVATALQDTAVVALAAVETEVAEDGTLAEVRHSNGHVALDAPAVVSGVMCVSAVHAERRVRDAVRRAADGPEGTGTCTGLGGLHAAMAAGRLDPYRAGVVAFELEEVPAEIAATIVVSLSEWFDREDASHLRRRTRRLLARISPDLLRQRAVRAREASGLRRWVDEPGVDTWLGTFPSEEACTAWAAIDALAQQYLTDGTCERVDRARAKALTDLVTSNATIDLQVVLTTAAGDPVPGAEAGRPADLVEVSGARAGEPVLVHRAWLDRAIERTVVSGRDPLGRPRLLPCDPGTGAPVDPTGELSTTAYRPSARLVAFVRARDQHCRFPGCSVAARFCDLDHVRPSPAGPTSVANLACLCRRHHRVKQRPAWRATLHPDATMTWTDPTGRTRITHPPDALHPISLPDTGTNRPPPPTNHSLVVPDGPHSALEHHLEHEAAGPTTCRAHVVRPSVPVAHDARPHPPPRCRTSTSGRPPF
ncbi:HNH endonuclease signature motif containing protein [Phycicoccus sonneratiae]|uniref:HNH endonuclease n=1 Tax=Phycicoccus sonneratiae TaxID=2807628 RepID=A0ABS2CPC9_9MICO|nr:HNH endonuclease signature motif containing protein [Phycicoccus sonneraticus]MBM6401006.1 HNH endonuclease [Phycicoccus sonneraticus]